MKRFTPTRPTTWTRPVKTIAVTIAALPLITVASAGTSYALWNSTVDVPIQPTTINMFIPTTALTWTGGTTNLYDLKQTQIDIPGLTGSYSNSPDDNTNTTTGWIYRAVLINATTQKTGTLTLETVSGTPVLPDKTPQPTTTIVPTTENIRTVTNPADCNNNPDTVKNLEYAAKTKWSGDATQTNLCVTQRRELLITRNGTISFTTEGEADQPDGSEPPNPVKPTDETNILIPVLEDMGADMIAVKATYTITETTNAGRCD